MWLLGFATCRGMLQRHLASVCSFNYSCVVISGCSCGRHGSAGHLACFRQQATNGAEQHNSSAKGQDVEKWLMKEGRKANLNHLPSEAIRKMTLHLLISNSL